MKSTYLTRPIRVLLPILIPLAAVAAAYGLVVSRPEPPASPVTERVIPVETMNVHSEDVVFTVASQGNVESRTQSTLVSEVSATVTDVSDRLVVGGFFSEGEVILQLDPADYETAVDQARAAVLAAEAQLAQEAAQAEQAGREWDLSGRSRDEAPALALRTPFLREAEARVLSAESDLRRAERQLARTTVRAPYDGLVREKFADIGQYVGTGSQLLRLAATDYAEVRLPLSGSDLQWLNLPRPGQQPEEGIPVTFYKDRHQALAVGQQGVGRHEGKQKWHGVISRTEAAVSRDSRMHYAVARIDDPYALQNPSTAPLPIGSFVNASLRGRSASGVFALPHSVVRNGSEVLVVDREQRLRRRQVNIVRSDADRVYIDQGLNDNEVIITSPVQIPVDGMRVRTGGTTL